MEFTVKESRWKELVGWGSTIGKSERVHEDKRKGVSRKVFNFHKNIPTNKQ